MPDGSKQRSTPRKRRSAKPRPDHEFFVIEITGWDWSFMFGTNNVRFFPGPYSDSRHIEIEGRLVCPSRLKVSSVHAVLMPEPRPLPENREKDHPVAVGWISCYQGRFELLQPIPLDATAPILQMLIADRFHFITLSATRLKHGKANVQTFHLVTHIDADDLPLES